MAKLSVTLRNEKRKKMTAQHAAKRELYKAAATDDTKTYEERAEAQKKLQALPRNSSATRVRSRCVMTGRGRAVYRKFGLCRIKFRELALEGKIPGVTKASW